MDILVNETSRYWVEKALQVVLSALSKDCLKKIMPVEAKGNEAERGKFILRLARSLVGIAPWLQTGTFLPRKKASGTY